MSPRDSGMSAADSAAVDSAASDSADEKSGSRPLRKLLLKGVGWICVIVAAYFAMRWLFGDVDQERSLKLYSLAMTSIPFRKFMLIAWLCHLLNSIPFIGLGTAAAAFDLWVVLALSGLVVVLSGVGYWLKQTVRR